MPSNPDCCIVEVFGEALGLLVDDGEALTFYASAPEVWSLDGRVFATVTAAQRAATACVTTTRTANRRARRGSTQRGLIQQPQQLT